MLNNYVEKQKVQSYLKNSSIAVIVREYFKNISDYKNNAKVFFIPKNLRTSTFTSFFSIYASL